MKTDWIEQLNEQADKRWPLGDHRTYDQQTRDCLEELICYLDLKKLGPDFMQWFKRRAKVEAEGGDAYEVIP